MRWNGSDTTAEADHLASPHRTASAPSRRGNDSTHLLNRHVFRSTLLGRVVESARVQARSKTSRTSCTGGPWPFSRRQRVDRLALTIPTLPEHSPRRACRVSVPPYNVARGAEDRLRKTLLQSCR